jgi:hypothetical protein
VAEASMESSVGKASMEKFPMAKASMAEASMAEASMAKTSMEAPVAKASAAPHEIDHLCRLPYIGHNQVRLQGSRQGRLSEQHGCSCARSQYSRSHERSHFQLLIN